jgi:hypothetical protein
LVALGGAALFAGAAGCSLGGLVFDIPSEGTGGGTGSSASSNTGGAAQSSASTGVPPGEICTNGSDDDGDGTIDCNDLDCNASGFSCFEPAPDGWMGPVLFFHGSAASVPTCPDPYPNLAVKGGVGLIYKPANCNSCSCSSVSLTCKHPLIGVAAEAECMNPVMPAPEFAPTTGTQCGAVMMEVGYGFGADKPTVGVTGCTPEGGGASLTEPEFEESALICSANGTGACTSDNGQVCAISAVPGFHEGPCIYSPGYNDCPGSYTEHHIMGENSEYGDDRTCSDCSCTSPGQFSCDLTYTLYSDAMCTTSVLSFPADGATCTPAAAGVTASSYKAAFSFKGSCTASGGTPKGGAWEKSPVTVCCIPSPSP